MTEHSMTIVDPVCGMAVDRRQAIWFEHDGETHYFCDRVCRETFREDPMRWLGGDEGSAFRHDHRMPTS